MKRIGVAASKISKGNLFLYNLYVVLITMLISAFIFVITGSIVIFAITIIAYIGDEIMGVEFERNWTSVLALCLGALTVVIGLFNIFAILKNFKLPRRRVKNGN